VKREARRRKAFLVQVLAAFDLLQMNSFRFSSLVRVLYYGTILYMRFRDNRVNNDETQTSFCLVVVINGFLL